ncbi:MAG: hypothetical protein ACI9YT_000195 [Halobacteriales archaeon]|jgi:hypothetical protein
MPILPDGVLRSRKLRGIVRIQAGFSLVRSHYADVRSPERTSAHLFDVMLYRREDPDEPFEEWIEHRELE